MSGDTKPPPPAAGGGASPAGGCVAPCPAAPVEDPCGKDAISNVTKCCGSEIVEEAKKGIGKEPKIEFGTPAGGFDGHADTTTGTVVVKDTKNKCNDTETVFFELANLAAKPEFDKAAADAQAGNLSREDYAKRYEKIEYNNTRKALAAIDKCKKKWGCEKFAFSFDGMRPAKDFDDYYNHYLREDHKNYYRNFWDANYKPLYNAKHPPPAPPAPKK